MTLQKIDDSKITIDIPSQRIERHGWVTMPLPSLREFDRFIGWAIGRLALGTLAFTVEAADNTFKFGSWCCGWLRQGIKKVTGVYDSLPLMGIPMQSVVAQLPDTNQTSGLTEITTIDLLDAIAGKHLIIMGDTGTGKSTIAQWIAASIGGEVRVYDSDASPDEWPGLNVVGRKGNFAAIAEAMQEDLAELQRRIELRGEYGDKALAGMESVTIAEEFPLLVDEIEIAPDWFKKHGRRGRKPKRLIIALSQDDAVKTFGIEGEGAVRKNFRYVRLGKFAVIHAKSLKNEALVAWLQAGKYRAMVDDMPCQLPDLRGYGQVTPQVKNAIAFSAPVTPETPTQQGLEPILPPPAAVDSRLKAAVLALTEAGWSDSRIIKKVLGMEGGNFEKGKNILESWRKDS